MNSFLKHDYIRVANLYITHEHMNFSSEINNKRLIIFTRHSLDGNIIISQ